MNNAKCLNEIKRKIAIGVIEEDVELLCRIMYKYGLIEKEDGHWVIEYEEEEDLKY